MSRFKLPLAGGCQCGALRYQVRAEPLALYACHCTECQRQSGGAFGMSMPVPRDGVRITAGACKTWDRIAGSGATVTAMFCPDCGTRVYHEPASLPSITMIKPGTLDDTSWLEPIAHYWTRSAQPWTRPMHQGLVFERQSPNIDIAIRAWRARESGG